MQLGDASLFLCMYCGKRYDEHQEWTVHANSSTGVTCEGLKAGFRVAERVAENAGAIPLPRLDIPGVDFHRLAWPPCTIPGCHVCSGAIADRARNPEEPRA